MLDIAEDYGWYIDWWEEGVEIWSTSKTRRLLFKWNIAHWDSNAPDTI